MTQDQLNQLVADATGEDLAEIQHRGFSMLEPDAAFSTWHPFIPYASVNA